MSHISRYHRPILVISLSWGQFDLVKIAPVGGGGVREDCTSSTPPGVDNKENDDREGLLLKLAFILNSMAVNMLRSSSVELRVPLSSRSYRLHRVLTISITCQPG